MEVNKNLEKRKNLEIVVLSIIIVALLGVLVYLLFIKKDDKSVENNTNNSQQVENNNQTNNTEPFDIADAYDLLLKINYSNKDYYSSTLVNVKDIKNEFKVGHILDIIEKSNLDESSEMYKNGYDSYVSENNVKEKYESIYADDYQPVNNGESGCNAWAKNNGNYYMKNYGCGSGTISDDALDEIVSANKNGNNLEIVAYVVIFDLFDKHELRDYTNNKLILQNSSINEKLDYPEELEKFNLSQYANQFQHYKFNFVLKNNNYTLSSVEQVSK